MSKYKLNVSDALGVIVCAAEARKDQYATIARRDGVEAATEELWDVGVSEAERMQAMLTEALDVIREHRDSVLEQKRELDERRRQVERRSATENEDRNIAADRYAKLSMLVKEMLRWLGHTASGVESGIIVDAKHAEKALRYAQREFTNREMEIATGSVGHLTEKWEELRGQVRAQALHGRSGMIVSDKPPKRVQMMEIDHKGGFISINTPEGKSKHVPPVQEHEESAD